MRVSVQTPGTRRQSRVSTTATMTGNDSSRLRKPSWR
jgi:hypothetical protein